MASAVAWAEAVDSEEVSAAFGMGTVVEDATRVGAATMDKLVAVGMAVAPGVAREVVVREAVEMARVAGVREGGLVTVVAMVMGLVTEVKEEKGAEEAVVEVERGLTGKVAVVMVAVDAGGLKGWLAGAGTVEGVGAAPVALALLAADS